MAKEAKEEKVQALKLEAENKIKIKIDKDESGSIAEGIEIDMPKEDETGDDSTTLEVYGMMKMSKEVVQSTVHLDVVQARHLLNRYLETQKRRKASQLQLMAVQQNERTEYENRIKVIDSNCAMVWIFEQEYNTELQIQKMLEAWVKEQPMGRYLLAIKGMGPIFAAKLLAYLSLDNTKHESTFYPGKTVHNRSSFIQYAGLNDNNCPWLGTEKANALVNEAYKECGVDPKSDPTEEVLIYVANHSGRRVDTVMRGATVRPSKKRDATEEDNKNVGKITKKSLTMYMAKPPYNTDLKTTCFLIGNSFMFNANRGSKYGQIYLARKQYEIEKNDRGEYAEQAAELLRTKNYSKGTDTYKSLSEGKLTLGHITQRAKRYAVKIFLNHLFEAMYYERFGEMAPMPWALTYTEHEDYIEPEVDYREYFGSKNNRITAGTMK